jgi:hypothetical protein
MPRLSGRRATTILTQGVETPTGQFVIYLPPDRIEIDRRGYQREMSDAKVNTIYRDFDPVALGILHIGLRNGRYYVIDGQHRLEAAKQILRDPRRRRELPRGIVLCLVFPDTSRITEAQKFVKLNTSWRITGNSLFKARLAYNSSPEREIKQIVEAQGFRLAFLAAGRPRPDTLQPHDIYKVSELLHAYNKGIEHFRNAITLLRLAWGNGEATQVPHFHRNAAIIHGLTYYVMTQNGEIEDIAARLVGWPGIEDAWEEANDTRLGFGRYRRFAEIIRRAQPAQPRNLRMA